jgi:hypothetical protein
MDFNCEKCGYEKSYSTQFDAYYCAKCNEWCEKTCSDVTCMFCSNRPEKPIKEEKWK